MKRQQGQSAVEFALMAPIIFLMIFGMIYSGIMFMEYLHYSNAVRTAARTIAVDSSKMESQKDWLEKLWKNEVSVKFYEPKVSITTDSSDVKIDVTFERDDSIPNILKAINFPPKYIKALSYTMKLEGTGT